MISIIIPVYNEQSSIVELVERIDVSLVAHNISYEIIIIDDNSTDRTVELVSSLKGIYPVRLESKKGSKGKAESLLEGFALAKNSIIGMIDGDLQYPPEKIPEMLNKLTMLDVVVANRKVQRVPLLRRLLSRVFTKIFAEIILGLPYDVQSGLKVFKKKTLEDLDLSPTQWGFDYEFLYKSRRSGYMIGEVDVVFDDRSFGESNINSLRVGVELAYGVFALRLSSAITDLKKLTRSINLGKLLGSR